MDHLYYLCLVFFMLSRPFIAALWSPAGKGLTSWHLLVMFNCVFVTFLCGILCQVWYLIVSIPNLCRLSYLSRSGARSQKKSSSVVGHELELAIKRDLYGILGNQYIVRSFP